MCAENGSDGWSTDEAMNFLQLRSSSVFLRGWKKRTSAPEAEQPFAEFIRPF
jgi:hypothetical protein